ncbi:MAG: hypothetical protein F6K28_49395 [Microcoleus sp. SIO2G3]|nr:hypothetical protein [Microcoleus sp. SIO2G3]
MPLATSTAKGLQPMKKIMMVRNRLKCLTMTQDKKPRHQRRTQIDISDVQDKIEGLRSDVTWRELPLSMKCRILILERLEQIEGASTAKSK